MLQKRNAVQTGVSLTLLSAICFYGTSLFVKFGSPEDLIFARFVVGLIIVSALLGLRRQSLNITRGRLLFGRAIFNFIATYAFFKSVSIAGASFGNVMSMTYPIFASILSFFFLPKDYGAYIASFIAFIGIYLVSDPGHASLDAIIWGLTCGFFGALSILSLNVISRENSSLVVLFYLFLVGSIASLLLFDTPSFENIEMLIGCGVVGFLGQHFLTLGSRFLTAVESGIVSTSRILIAVIITPLLFEGEFLGYVGAFGAFLILLSNIFLIVRKSKSFV